MFTQQDTNNRYKQNTNRYKKTNKINHDLNVKAIDRCEKK